MKISIRFRLVRYGLFLIAFVLRYFLPLDLTSKEISQFINLLIPAGGTELFFSWLPSFLQASCLDPKSLGEVLVVIVLVVFSSNEWWVTLSSVLSSDTNFFARIHHNW